LIVAPDLANEEDIAKLIIPDDLPDEPSFKAYIEAKVYDKEGHLIQYRRQPMRSLTQYFLALMSIPIIGTYKNPSTAQAPNILVNVLGLPSQQSTYIYSGNTVYNASNILWDWSIRLGSGTQSFSPTLNSLAAPIANGTGAGQLVYGALSVAYTATSIIPSITVVNYSAFAVSITEIGLLGNIYIQYRSSSDTYAYNTYSFLLSYDTFTTPISIPSNGLAAFQITLTFKG
jgi:hypothetical protein